MMVSESETLINCLEDRLIKESTLIGVELAGSEASSRARGYYLIQELRDRGYRISEKKEIPGKVDIAILQSGGFSRQFFGKATVFDVSDAILIPPNYNNFLKRMYQKLVVNGKWRKFIAQCDAVVVASQAQKKSMRAFASKVYVIPDVSFYHEHYVKKEKCFEKVKFVWDGQGHNFPYLENIIRENLDFFKRSDVELVVVTDVYDTINRRDNRQRLFNYQVNSRFIEWQSDSFVSEVGKCDIGLAPVDLGCAHARAKPSNKLVNYGGLGLPCIASRIPAYQEFSDGVGPSGGISLCSSSDEWSTALRYWADNKSQLDGVSESLNRYVTENYSPGVLIDKWEEVLRHLSVGT